MPQCSALNCKNRGIHLFPKESKRRKQWESALRIKNFEASSTARLCVAHFTEKDYYGKINYTGYELLAKFLKKTAVLSVFFLTKIKPENPAAVAHQQRIERRSQSSNKCR
ncbi:THAP domain-containing protein 1 B-like [Manduca sexta]|uniref:THAP domain-containing protein 1 B-like n=1 Tax=Manduca sexta TaxID=7130 RepID=UPI001890798F|nr:THAP domain-containing protein 1 B-like [Manduca sexta]